jgi:hypothetical protein
MARFATVVRKEPWDVDARLAGLSLTRPGLLKVRTVARSAAADATPFHPLNAAGTLAYQHGTFGLRDEFVGDAWVVARPEAVEAIFNAKANTMVVFGNVDVACDENQEPQPRSRKGSGAERVCQGNLFGALPRFAPRQAGGASVFYLMVDENGATELSIPIVEGGTFTGFVERNFLSDGDDLDGALRTFDDGDIADNFDPQVVRKRG